ncbi:hypothetical protein C0J52_01030 [Blattella germanica]|nr:hypothetical protein C0J52_01030 [Blattella germanica]
MFVCVVLVGNSSRVKPGVSFSSILSWWNDRQCLATASTFYLWSIRLWHRTSLLSEKAK